MKTQAVTFSKLGLPDQLAVGEIDIEAPSENEVQVELRYAGLNRAELLFLAGEYLVSPILPSKIGLEGAGVIKAIGSNVNHLKVGDRVCITPNIDPEHHGVLAKLSMVPARSIIPLPDSVDFKTGAAFWMAYGTAYGGLALAGKLEKLNNKFVVITAASSSVGIAAVQLAKANGAKVIITSRGTSKLKQLEALQADHIIVTDQQDFPSKIAEITSGRGFDVSFDSVGGQMLTDLAKAAGRGATIIQYGLLAGKNEEFPFFELLSQAATVKTFHLVFDLLSHPTRLEHAQAYLNTQLENGICKPIFDSEFELNNIISAYQRLASNEQFGKVMVKIY